MFDKEKIITMLNDDIRIVELWQKRLDVAENEIEVKVAKYGLNSALVKQHSHKDMLLACGFIIDYKNDTVVNVEYV